MWLLRLRRRHIEGAVTRTLYHRNELLWTYRLGVVLDGRRFGSEVDAGADPVKLIELALDAGGAGGARHARDAKVQVGHSLAYFSV